MRAETRLQVIKRAVWTLEHTSTCRRIICLEDCRKIKKMIAHTKRCSRKAIGNCPICRELVGFVVMHAKECKVENCNVYICIPVKKKLRAQAAAQ